MQEKKDSKLNPLLAKRVPENLQLTLDAAFSKAFSKKLQGQEQ